MLYYSVAHYYDVDTTKHYQYGMSRGKNKYKNIECHINEFKNLENKNNVFVLTSSINTERGDKRYEDIKNELYKFCKKLLPDNNVYIIIKYNWGGTISALWYVHNFLKGKEGHIAHFEEDFGPMNSKWYEDSVNILKDDKIIYLGESTTGSIKRGNSDGRINDLVHANQPRLGNPEVWTDGGFYFTTLKNLHIMEKNIGIFHKGDQYKIYDSMLDGVSIGEVGFPTLLYHAGLKFIVLKRSEYFVNEWNDNS